MRSEEKMCNDKSAAEHWENEDGKAGRMQKTWKKDNKDSFYRTKNHKLTLLPSFQQKSRRASAAGER
jgi:hypothetical protein